jgi:heme ABC exporter ATP-binding subunit CcmA
VPGPLAVPLSVVHKAAIEARQLTFERDGRLVLDRIDLNISPGEIVAVLGTNGVGKTTLLRCLAALVAPMAGEVSWLGQSPQQNRALRRSIGIVAHEDWLYGELTPRENLLFSAEMYGVTRSGVRVEQLLSEARLLGHVSKPTDQLSHGMRRRLSICRALIHDPSILLLDEPFSGLDDQGRAWLEQLLARQRTCSKAICFTTHECGVAQSLADRQLLLAAGRLESLDSRPGHERQWEDAA